MAVLPQGVELRGSTEGRLAEVLTPTALDFVARLQRTFGPRREEILAARAARQKRLDAGELPDFLPATKEVREGDWKVLSVPLNLQNRRVEITGPTNRRMVINALNSGASCFMADLEDANTPTWENMVDGQLNLTDAIMRTIELTTPEGREYKLGEQVATLIVRPRGWHLVEKHMLVDGQPVSASLFDFGLYFLRNARRLLDRGMPIAFYLPKLEGHLEARLWNDVFNWAEDWVELPRGVTKATVLIETILAAFEMEEILYELREHIVGLNAGRWDYIFSIIKKLRAQRGPEWTLPDRAQVTMTVPFMRAYTELLTRTCHKRGAYAIGGMAAFIPSRRDAAVNDAAMARVREDKSREASDGMDGTWVAHPDLVPLAKEIFDARLGDQANQLANQREDVAVQGRQLIDLRVPDGKVTEAGLRMNVSVGLQYLNAWLSGNGAAAINNLMEDVATAEISRSQVWQWVQQGTKLDDGRPVTKELVRSILDEEVGKLKLERGEDARRVFEQVALADEFVEFLTWSAYELID